MSALRIAAAALLCCLATPAPAVDVPAQHVQPGLRATAFHKFIPPGCSMQHTEKCFPLGTLIVRYRPIAEVEALCNSLAPLFGYAPVPKGAVGCTMGGATDARYHDVAVIVVGDDYDTEDTFFHEIAHANGLNARHDNY